MSCQIVAALVPHQGKRGGSARRLACWSEGIGGNDQDGLFGLPRVRWASCSRALVTRPRPVVMLNSSDLLGMRLVS